MRCELYLKVSHWNLRRRQFWHPGLLLATLKSLEVNWIISDLANKRAFTRESEVLRHQVRLRRVRKAATTARRLIRNWRIEFWIISLNGNYQLARAHKIKVDTKLSKAEEERLDAVSGRRTFRRESVNI